MDNKKEYLSSFFKKTAGLFQKNMFLRNSKKIMYYVDAVLLFFIKKPKKQESKKKKVLIIYNIALGDGVIFRCSSIHLRNVYPKSQYELTLLCQKGLETIYNKDNVFDKIVSINFNKSTVNLKNRFKDFKTVRNDYYDIIVDPVGIFEWTTNIFFTRAAIGSKKIGVVDKNLKQYCSARKVKKIYTDVIEINKKNVSLLEYYSLVLNELSEGKYVYDVGFEKLVTQPNKAKLPKKYFVIFPSASMKLKRWNLDKYADLASKIYKKTNMPLVLLGTKADLEVLNLFKQKLKIDFIDLVDKTSLNDYIDILSKASLVVTNDTSSYHIALTQNVPVAIITGGYTYDRYVLYDFPRKNEFIRPCIIVHNMPCFNCNNRCKYLKSNNENWPCLEKITVEYAWKLIEKYIDENKIK